MTTHFALPSHQLNGGDEPVEAELMDHTGVEQAGLIACMHKLHPGPTPHVQSSSAMMHQLRQCFTLSEEEKREAKSLNWEPPGQAQRSPGPFGPGTPKESEKSPKGVPPRGPQNPQRVRHGVRKESKNAVSDSFWTLFGLRGALFGDWGSPGRDTLSDSFRTLLGVRETSVPGQGFPILEEDAPARCFSCTAVVRPQPPPQGATATGFTPATLMSRHHQLYNLLTAAEQTDYEQRARQESKNRSAAILQEQGRLDSVVAAARGKRAQRVWQKSAKITTFGLSRYSSDDTHRLGNEWRRGCEHFCHYYLLGDPDPFASGAPSQLRCQLGLGRLADLGDRSWAKLRALKI